MLAQQKLASIFGFGSRIRETKLWVSLHIASFAYRHDDCDARDHQVVVIFSREHQSVNGEDEKGAKNNKVIFSPRMPKAASTE